MEAHQKKEEEVRLRRETDNAAWQARAAQLVRAQQIAEQQRVEEIVMAEGKARQRREIRSLELQERNRKTEAGKAEVRQSAAGKKIAAKIRRAESKKIKQQLLQQQRPWWKPEIALPAWVLPVTGVCTLLVAVVWMLSVQSPEDELLARITLGDVGGVNWMLENEAVALAGLDINNVDALGGISPLMIAASQTPMSKQQVMIQLLLRKGADLETREPTLGVTSLWAAHLSDTSLLS